MAIARLRAHVREEHEPGEGVRRAAVAAAVVDEGDGLGLWLTRRASRMREHPGQWALPGGRIDDADADAEAAALRELDEELGVRIDRRAVIGRLDDYPTRSGYVITPVVIWVGHLAGFIEPNPDEVAFVTNLALHEVDVEPNFISIPESDRPVIQLPIRGHLIHAPTAAVLHQFREVVMHGRSTRVSGYEQPVFAWR